MPRRLVEMIYAKRIVGIEPSGIRKILDMAARVADPVDMSIGQPDFDVPEPIKEACVRAIHEGFNRYTQSAGIPELREAILAYLHSRGRFAEDVLITNGAAGALVLFFMALVEEGDEVVLTDPYFLNYRHLVTLTRAVPKYINTYPHFRLTEEEIQRAIGPKTKLIVINSPGNPTGIVYSHKELQWLVEAARKHDCWIISDEVYEGFVYDRREYVSPASLYEKTLIVNSFSKSAGMPGWRIGFGSGPKKLLADLIPLQQYFYGCAPSMVQKAALLCVARDMSADLARMQRKRDLIYQGLKDFYPLEKPEGAFYLFAGAPQGDCYRFIENALQHKVFVSPGDTFSRRATHFRISFAIPEPSLLRGIEILQEIAG